MNMLRKQIARLRQLALALVFIISGVLFPLALSQPAEASLYLCRGDPVLNLSDGLKVTLMVDLTIPASRVLSVIYTVHAPAGAQLKKVTYPIDALVGKESVVFLPDSPDALYHVSALVMVLPGAPGSVLLSGLNKKTLVSNTGPTGTTIMVALTSQK